MRIFLLIAGIFVLIFAYQVTTKRQEEQELRMAQNACIKTLKSLDTDFFSPYDNDKDSILALFEEEIKKAESLNLDVETFKKNLPEKKALITLSRVYEVGSIEEKKEILESVNKNAITWSDNGEQEYDNIQRHIDFKEAVLAMHELWNPILYRQPYPSEKRLAEIKTILEKYDGNPIVNTALGMNHGLVEFMMKIYPSLKTELERIYHS